MNFGEAITSAFRNYVTFSGRASRSEFWYWILFALIVGLVTGTLDAAIFPESETPPLNSAAALILFLPGLSVGVRRLHDIDRTGWWYLICFTIIGIFLLIYWACQPGTPGANRFGPPPAPTG